MAKTLAPMFYVTMQIIQVKILKFFFDNPVDN